MESAGDNVDEAGRSALVRRGGDEWVGRWCAVERLSLLADGSAPGMPNKHNDDRRHPIPKMTFTVTNWAIYEGGTTGRSTFAPSPKLAIECTYIAPTVQEEAPVGLDFLAVYG